MMYAVFDTRTGRILALFGNLKAAEVNASSPWLVVRRVYTRSLRRGR